MISFALDEDQALLQRTVRKFAAEHLRPNARRWERARGVPDDARRSIHELGLGLIDVPEALGGVGAGAFASMIVHEELAFGDAGAAVTLYAPHTAAAAIVELGDAAQAKRLLARFAGPTPTLGAVAWSDAGMPRDLPLAGFATTATPTTGGHTLRGKKAFVVNAGLADLTVVFAQLDGGPPGWEGIAAFALENVDGKPPAGVTAGARHATLGLETVSASELLLDGVFVPDANRLRAPAAASFLDGTRRFFARVALQNAAHQVGLARAAYELALAYTQERHAFGKPVAHFQSIAFTLAEMLMDVESARWLLWQAATGLDRAPLGARLDTVAIAHAAVHANQSAWRVADNGVQLLGGAGFIQDFPAEKWLRDTRALALFAPSDELWQLAAAGALVDPVGVPRDGLESALPSISLQPIFT